VIRCAALGATIAAASSVAAAPECRLALVLAIDVSASIDADEYRLQQNGLAAALTSQDVQNAILGGSGHVAIAVFEWSGRQQHKTIADWTILSSQQSISGVAAQIVASDYNPKRHATSLGHSIMESGRILEKAPQCARRVVDISGDGVNNDGFGPDIAFEIARLENVTVNGLAIEADNPNLARYYSTHVARGPGSFVERAADFEDFERAMTLKLFREISDIKIGAITPIHDAPNL